MSFFSSQKLNQDPKVSNVLNLLKYYVIGAYNKSQIQIKLCLRNVSESIINVFLPYPCTRNTTNYSNIVAVYELYISLGFFILELIYRIDLQQIPETLQKAPANICNFCVSNSYLTQHLVFFVINIFFSELLL